ncbi:hypothetical protein [Streptomyces lancefieldiae]|uniref:Uncharacterized protein n=1 Tax=Streptomyces lancefieldiae TaxID=3075520 RepID=A0ABU3AF65_9ACTN|nr:hypothetical protein [Streptomyces sp. DSM 40712]MDT0608831.1 hypothetical protein [Streptomyces sp. DSM 40712]
MATQILPAPDSAENAGTAPLPPAAVEAIARLESAFLPVPLDVVRAVARYEAAAFRYDELAARPASSLSPAEFDAIRLSQETMTQAFVILADAGQTGMLAPLEVATSYRYAAAHCRERAEAADFDGCLAAQDEMRMCRCQLEQAGRLDLIGAA